MTHCAPQRPWDPLTELCYQEGPVYTIQAQSPSPVPRNNHCGTRMGHPNCQLAGAPRTHWGAAPCSPVPPGELVPHVLGGEAVGTAGRDPRDAGGLFSVLTGLSKQLYILTEAEEPPIGCMGIHFQL